MVFILANGKAAIVASAALAQKDQAAFDLFITKFNKTNVGEKFNHGDGWLNLAANCIKKGKFTQASIYIKSGIDNILTYIKAVSQSKAKYEHKEWLQSELQESAGIAIDRFQEINQKLNAYLTKKVSITKSELRQIKLIAARINQALNGINIKRDPNWNKGIKLRLAKHKITTAIKIIDNEHIEEFELDAAINKIMLSFETTLKLAKEKSPSTRGTKRDRYDFDSEDESEYEDSESEYEDSEAEEHHSNKAAGGAGGGAGAGYRAASLLEIINSRTQGYNKTDSLDIKKRATALILADAIIQNPSEENIEAQLKSLEMPLTDFYDLLKIAGKIKAFVIIHNAMLPQDKINFRTGTTHPNLKKLQIEYSKAKDTLVSLGKLFASRKRRFLDIPRAEEEKKAAANLSILDDADYQAWKISYMHGSSSDVILWKKPETPLSTLICWNKDQTANKKIKKRITNDIDILLRGYTNTGGSSKKPAKPRTELSPTYLLKLYKAYYELINKKPFFEQKFAFEYLTPANVVREWINVRIKAYAKDHPTAVAVCGVYLNELDILRKHALTMLSKNGCVLASDFGDLELKTNVTTKGFNDWLQHEITPLVNPTTKAPKTVDQAKERVRKRQKTQTATTFKDTNTNTNEAAANVI